MQGSAIDVSCIYHTREDMRVWARILGTQRKSPPPTGRVGGTFAAGVLKREHELTEYRW
jgi:hypothetical protein